MLRIQFVGILVMLTGVVFGQVDSKWVKHFGGLGVEMCGGIVTDFQKNIYLSGIYESTFDADPSLNTHLLVSSGDVCNFLIKLDENGNFVWAKQISAIHPSFGVVGGYINIDDSSNLYIVGLFKDSIDCDPSTNEFILFSPTLVSYLCKLDKDGNFLWAKILGPQFVTPITFDKYWNIYYTGHFYDTVDFDPGAGIYQQVALAAPGDFFTCKLNRNGELKWVKLFNGLGGSGIGKGITVDKFESVIVTGTFQDTIDFDASSNVYNLSSQNGNAFILSIDTNGNFNWAKAYGTKISTLAHVNPTSIIADSNKNLYWGGHFKGSVDIDPAVGVTSITSNGTQDAFVCKLDSLGNLIWNKTLGGKLDDWFVHIKLDKFNNPLFSVNFKDSLFLSMPDGSNTLFQAGFNFNSAIINLNPNGEISWAKQIGDSNNCKSLVYIDESNIFSYGVFDKTCLFEVDNGFQAIQSVGNDDCFLLKMTSWPTNIPPLPNTEEVLLYPNPSNQSSILQFTSQQQSPYQISIYSITGSLIKNSNGVAIIGENKITLDIENLPPSMYFVRLKLQEEFMQTFKLTTY